MSQNAPIIIFCYRRKINKLIDSLVKNKEAAHSDLFIFSDGFKSHKDKQDVLDLRQTLKNIKGFKSIKIFESDQNKGLANSIIDGTTSIINNFGKAIVLEDDLLVSEHLLNFMNRALNFYQLDNNVWSISGFSPPMPNLKNFKDEVYMSLRSSSWGWATWLDRWNKSDWTIKNFDNFRKDKHKIKQFEMGGNDMFKMLELEYLKKIDSWAIRWCYSQFLNSAYSITPKISMVQNIGFSDNLGTHNNNSKNHIEVNLAEIPIGNFKASLSDEIFKHFKKYHDLSFYTKIGYFLKKWGGYKITKNLIKNFKLK